MSTTPTVTGQQCLDVINFAAALKIKGEGSTPCCQWSSVKCNTDGQVTYIEWSNRSATGQIPNSILQQFLSLEYLDLSSNQITGSIPSVLGRLTKLTYLSLSGNQFSGGIPSTLGQLSNLNYLALPKNALTGAIPSSLGQLSNLKELDLNGNLLNGTIPESIGSLQNLKLLWLQNNELRGQIPAVLGSLTRLTDVVLSNNRFIDRIPALPASNNCTIFPQQLASSLCYAGITRVGKCYGEITSSGVKDCSAPATSNIATTDSPSITTHIGPILAGVAGFVAVMIAIGLFMYRRRRQATTATPLVLKHSDQSSLLPTDAVALDPKDSDPALLFPNTVVDVCGTDTLVPDPLNTLERMELPTSTTKDLAGANLADRVASDTDSIGSLILPGAGGHQSWVGSSIDPLSGVERTEATCTMRSRATTMTAVGDLVLPGARSQQDWVRHSIASSLGTEWAEILTLHSVEGTATEGLILPSAVEGMHMDTRELDDDIGASSQSLLK